MEAILGVIVIILVVGSFAAAIVRPGICFVLVIAYPVIEQAVQSYFPFFNTHRSLFNFMIAGLVALTVAVRFFRDPNAWRGLRNPVQMMGYLLICISYLSLFWTPELDNGLEYTFRRLPYTLLYMVLAPLLLTSLDDFRRVRIPMVVIATVALLLFVLGPAAQFYGARLVIHYGTAQRGNSLIVGELGAIVLIFAALSTYKRLGKLALPLQLAAGLFGLGMGMFSGSRGQVIFGGFVSFVFYPISRKIKDSKSYFGIGLGLVVLLGVIYGAIKLFITDENVERWSSGSFSGGVLGRWEIVYEAIVPWLSNPTAWIFGRGAGAFMSVNSAHVYPHNHPIEVLTELGVIGFTVYAFMLFFTLRASLGIYRIFKNDNELRSSMAVLFALSTFCFMLSLKQGSVHHLGLLYVWYFVLGRIYTYESEEEEMRPEEDLFEDDDEDDDEITDQESGYSHA